MAVAKDRIRVPLASLKVAKGAVAARGQLAPQALLAVLVVAVVALAPLPAAVVVDVGVEVAHPRQAIPLGPVAMPL